jgi:hypothetical protein
MTHKKLTQAELEKQIKEFFEKGGKVSELPASLQKRTTETTRQEVKKVTETYIHALG